MPASYRIDTSRRLVVTSATGVVSEDDLTGHQQRLRRDPGFDPSFDQILDFRNVTEMPISGESVRQYVARSPWGDGARRAFVCDRDLVYGLARMFEMLSADRPEAVQVFRTLQEAEAWLGLDDVSSSGH